MKRAQRRYGEAPLMPRALAEDYCPPLSPATLCRCAAEPLATGISAALPYLAITTNFLFSLSDTSFNLFN